LVGLAVGWLVGRLRDLLRHWRSSDPMIEITLSLMTCYAAYLMAERIDVSGVLAVVAAGLYSGGRDPARMDVETRQTAWAVWSLVIFWLNGLAFVLLGLQVPSVISGVRDEYSAIQVSGFALAIAGVAMLARLAWVFPGTYLPFLLRRVRARETRPSWQGVLVAGWAGMRGTVTLAAALSIPLALPDGSPFPHRDLVIFLAFGVIAVTLLVQGTTLEALIRRLGLREDDTRAREEHLARVAAVEAGLKVLRELEPTLTTPEQSAALGHVAAEYEHRLAELEAEGETRASSRRRRRAEHHYRSAALHAERKTVNELWRSETITDEVYRPLQQLLDHEEAMLRATPPTEED
jgi:CPA1 family monovalent cation:H+ antiporter